MWQSTRVRHCRVADFDETSAPNGLVFSGAALRERESVRADASNQKSPDLARREAASAATPCWAHGIGAAAEKDTTSELVRITHALLQA